jgi:hypothetical protein
MSVRRHCLNGCACTSAMPIMRIEKWACGVQSRNCSAVWRNIPRLHLSTSLQSLPGSGGSPRGPRDVGLKDQQSGINVIISSPSLSFPISCFLCPSGSHRGATLGAILNLTATRVYAQGRPHSILTWPSFRLPMPNHIRSSDHRLMNPAF